MRFILHGVALLLLLTSCKSGPFEEICTVTKLVVQKCWVRAQEEDRQNAFAGVKKCLKRKTLVAMDRLIAQETIRMPYGITLVRDEGSYRNGSSYDRRAERKNGKFYEMGDWKVQLIGKIGEVLRTHVFRFPLVNAEVVTGRRRHHHHSQGMMPLMLFGLMAMAIIAIPLGFQFLAVLGGKALLLAKLALILTSIQGLKKIAVSDVNYGFYESGSNHHHHPHDHLRQQHYLYDRRWQNGAPGHHGYDQGFPEGPDHQPDPMYHIRPRISNLVPPVDRD